MLILNTINDCKNWRADQKNSVGFVPTMGALHQGHLSLIQESKKHCSKTIVSIYINPTQFSENEDLSSYPKTITRDLNNLKKLKIDAVFLPTDEEMYPKGKTENFNYESPLFTKLEGKSRPHFFYGVTKIVSKLFNLVQPSHAFFGEKDAQQSRIIKQMSSDLNYNIIIVSCPTVRDKKGLALSSRNQYLSKAEQTKASIIYQSLIVIKQLIQGGQKNVQVLKKTFILSVNGCSGFTVEYISIACNESLKELDVWRPGSLISTAVFYKDVRLIDNLVY
tara:strand:- start:221 stop:1054 length:834 start_codon:yes stop_codon:yes gene_type:complete